MDPAVVLVSVCVFLGALWLTLAGLTVVNRALYDASTRLGGRRLSTAAGREQRLLRRAAAHHTERGRWRRVAALQALARARHPSAPELLERALADPDTEIVGAAVRALGEYGGDWAAQVLVEALRDEVYSRSRIAAQLERLAPRVGALLVPLLDDPQAPVRFWGATLLAQYPGRAVDELLARTRDDDPNVRAAAVETLGRSMEPAALDAALDLLDDPAWYVRAHACRAIGELGSDDVGDAIAPLLADEWWWVRTAAKDALRGFGPRVASAVTSFLEHPDRFARNGAAEVLQDLGVVDALVASDPGSPLLARIFAAGGPRMREAAHRRLEVAPQRQEVAA